MDCESGLFRSLERARKAGIKENAVLIGASETHNKENVSKTIDATIAAFEETSGPAREAGIRVRGYVSTVWGCPCEGSIAAAPPITTSSPPPRLGPATASAGAALYKFLQPGIYAYVTHNLIEAAELGATAHFKVEGKWNDDLMTQVLAPGEIPTAKTN